jgi:enoyl-CoA hydratase/carnithine racemase
MTAPPSYASGAIRYTRDGPIATFVIEGYNELNPMTPDMYLELHRRLLEFEDDPEVRVGIIRGAGDRHFTAGGNLKRSHRMQDELLNREAILKHFWYPLQQVPNSAWVVWETLFARRTVKPVVAAVQGYCLGAGMFVLCLHTDVRIAGESAQFGIPEVRRGIAAGSGGASQLARQVPHAAFSWMFETGLSVDAKRAREWFLVNEVVPDEHVFARAQAVAELIAANPPAPVRAEKLGLLQLEFMPYEDAAFFASTLRALAAEDGAANGSLA